MTTMIANSAAPLYRPQRLDAPFQIVLEQVRPACPYLVRPRRSCARDECISGRRTRDHGAGDGRLGAWKDRADATRSYARWVGLSVSSGRPPIGCGLLSRDSEFGNGLLQLGRRAPAFAGAQHLHSDRV